MLLAAQRCPAPARALVLLVVVVLASSASADRLTLFKSCMNSRLPSLAINLPGSNNFANIISKSVRTNRRAPAIVVQPNNERGVRVSVKCARSAGYPVCPRSGGHDYEGQSRCGGVMIDLVKLQGVQLKPSGVALIQPAAMLGQTVAELYRQSSPTNKRCMAVGVCPGVGIAGYLLGGGHGPYSGLLGLTCDSLVAVRMIDEFGNVIIANKRKNRDLLRASCGGSGGIFGIVTQFRIRTASCAKFDKAVIMRYQWNISVAGEVISKWFNYDHDGGNNWLRLEIPRNEGLVGYGVCWGTNSTSECEKRFEGAAFWNVPTRETLVLEKANNVLDAQAFLGPDGGWARYKAADPISALTDNRYHEAGDGNRRLYQSAMVKIDGPGGPPSANYWQTAADWCNDGIGNEAWSVCQWNPFVNEVKKPKDNLFPHRAANSITEYITAPTSAQNRRFGRRRMAQHLLDYTIGIYSNYPEPGRELPGPYQELYYGSSLPELEELKLKYNPCNFFAKEQTIPVSWTNCSFPE